MERRFGHDFSKVRVHADTRACDSVRTINALAYTVGHNIVFGAGQYAPQTQSGQKILAHELTHVVQQNNSGIRMLQCLCTEHSNESYYRSSTNYCRDTASTGSMHPNHRCYREVPTGSGCPSGEHVCFRNDTGQCDSSESHIDSTAPSISRASNGACNLSWMGLCTLIHGALDVVGPKVGDALRATGPPSTDPNSLEFKMWLRYHRRW
jgi:hypothetical protein